MKIALSAPNSTQTAEKSNLASVYAKQVLSLKMRIMKHGVEVHKGFRRWMFASAGDWPA